MGDMAWGNWIFSNKSCKILCEDAKVRIFYEHGIYSRGLKKLPTAGEQKTTQTISYKIRERYLVKNLRKPTEKIYQFWMRPPSLTHSRKVEEPPTLIVTFFHLTIPTLCKGRLRIRSRVTHAHDMVNKLSRMRIRHCTMKNAIWERSIKQRYRMVS